MMSLQHARMRIARAGHHLLALKAELAGLLSPGGVRVSIRADPRTHRNCIRAELAAELPPLLPAIIGDVVHNARAALDMALAQILIHRLGHSPRHIRFPVHASRESLLLACRREGLRELGPALLRAIVQDIRPYWGGRDRLCVLHELDIIDRQSALMPHVGIIELRNMQFEDIRGTVRFRTSALLDDRGLVQKPLLALAGPLRLLDPGHAVFAVTLPPGTPMAGSALIPTLAECVQASELAVSRLEATGCARSATMAG